MADALPHFEVSTGQTLSKAAAAVAETLGAECAREEGADRLYLDSFDWRLFNAGYVLERLSASGRTTLILRDRVSGSTVFVVEQRSVPRFAEDLPAGFLRDQLAPLLSMRALLPLARVKGRRVPIVRRDSDGKEVVRGTLEDIQISGPGARKGQSLGRRLILEPVRGYEKVLADTVRTLAKQPGFTEHKGGLFEEAMRCLSLTPGSYSSKLCLTLSPEMRADEAMQVILRDLLNTMAANEDGILADIDTEFLHDFRVAIRRTRSALTQIKGVLPQRLVERNKDAFRWLGQVTGPLRDLDVYLLTFSGYRNILPDDFRDSLDPLKRELERRREKELKAVTRSLKGARYAKVKKNWAAALDSLTKDNKAPQAATPVIEVADKRAWKLYKQVLDEGRAIDDSSPAEALHELRKTCKKLRYVMEFFDSLHDRGLVKDRIKAMKALQDDLGAFQDYAIQADTLTAIGNDMEKAGAAPRDTLLAMAILTEALYEKQRAARAAFAEIFNEFASNDSHAAFRALYKS